MGSFLILLPPAATYRTYRLTAAMHRRQDEQGFQRLGEPKRIKRTWDCQCQPCMRVRRERHIRGNKRLSPKDPKALMLRTWISCQKEH